MDKTKQIDEILKYLNHDDKSKETFSMIMERLPFKIEYKDLLLIINKLLKDGYIDVDYYLKGGIPSTEKQDRIYSITYEGIMFVGRGGYIQQAKDIKRGRRYDKWSVYIVAVVSAIIGSLLTNISDWRKELQAKPKDMYIVVPKEKIQNDTIYLKDSLKKK
jgi:hypothetical protein